MSPQYFLSQQAPSYPFSALPALVFKLGAHPSTSTRLSRGRVVPLNFIGMRRAIPTAFAEENGSDYIADDEMAEGESESGSNQDVAMEEDTDVDFEHRAYSVNGLLDTLPNTPSNNSMNSILGTSLSQRRRLNRKIARSHRKASSKARASFAEESYRTSSRRQNLPHERNGRNSTRNSSTFTEADPMVIEQ